MTITSSFLSGLLSCMLQGDVGPLQSQGSPIGQWGPLHRLQRSFDNFNQKYRPGYSGEDWQALMDGYQS